jgi:hypothetical protein
MFYGFALAKYPIHTFIHSNSDRFPVIKGIFWQVCNRKKEIAYEKNSLLGFIITSLIKVSFSL